MNCTLAKPEESILVVLDLQSSLLRIMPNSERLVERARFLVQTAQLMGVPVIHSEQNAAKLGGTAERIEEIIRPVAKIDKTTFSAAAWPTFMQALQASGRRQVVLTGIETHICVVQTLLSLVEQGYSAIACTDALGSRTEDRHQAGLERLRAAGVSLAHTESVAYEWLHDSASPKFKEALRIVKEAPL
jgi:nicotinamidase-related amidase